MATLYTVKSVSDVTFTAWTNAVAAIDTEVLNSVWDGWASTVATITSATTVTCYNETTGTTWGRWSSEARGLIAEKARKLSAQDVARIERERREQAERMRREEELRVYALGRAKGLLEEHLTPEQRAQVARDKFFVVVGGKSGRKYRIGAHGYTRNVEKLDERGLAVERRYCAHIEYAANAPLYDHLLAQKLMIEHDEEHFLRLANAA